VLLGDGDKLTSSQIKNLQDMKGVDLLVLSACQTAVGAKGQDGVEINSISYHFLNTGVKSIVSSLWLVDDASTKQLMHEFYHNLSQPNRTTKAESLRQAQLKLLHGNDRHFSRLHYWAPFILIGNGL
jgi:CHAT domain-containing protein